MFGVAYPIRPRLLWLILLVPISSPQITRMFGFCCCAAPEIKAVVASIITKIVLLRHFMVDFLH